MLSESLFFLLSSIAYMIEPSFIVMNSSTWCIPMNYDGSLWFLAYYFLLQLTWPFVFIHLFKLAAKIEFKKLLLLLVSGFVFVGFLWQFCSSTNWWAMLAISISMIVPPIFLIIWSISSAPMPKARAIVMIVLTSLSLPVLLIGLLMPNLFYAHLSGAWHQIVFSSNPLLSTNTKAINDQDKVY